LEAPTWRRSRRRTRRDRHGVRHRGGPVVADVSVDPIVWADAIEAKICVGGESRCVELIVGAPRIHEVDDDWVVLEVKRCDETATVALQPGRAGRHDGDKQLRPFGPLVER
jgi:hypothetical protein